ncbi:MAG: hypothetical protein IIA92_05310 [Chloroflexi bacterium]|nr:hypothetical protein [Chloroflexota bacterium]
MAFLRLIAVVLAVVGIVNITGIPERSDPAIGVLILGVAVGVWVLLNKVMQSAYDSALKKRLTREDLTEDEVELLGSREPTEEDYARVKYSSAKNTSPVNSEPSSRADESIQDLTRADAPQSMRPLIDVEPGPQQFCRYLVTANSMREFIWLASHAKREGRCRNVAGSAFMTGAAFARKYPGKARAILAREVNPPLHNHEVGKTEWSKYLRNADQENTSYRWLQERVFAHFEPVLTVEDGPDEEMFSAALVLAIRDGIAFELLVTNDQTKRFYRESEQINGVNLSHWARDIKRKLKSYESQYGNIEEQ